MKLYFSRHTLRELAELCNQDAGGLSKTMAGAQRPTVEVAHILAEALGVHVLFFLAPGWYDDDGSRLPPERTGELRAWKYGPRALTKKNRRLLAKNS